MSFFEIELQHLQEKKIPTLVMNEDNIPVGYELEDGEIYESIKIKKNREKNWLAAEEFMASLDVNFYIVE